MEKDTVLVIESRRNRSVSCRVAGMSRSALGRPSGGPVLQDTVTDALRTAFFAELADVGYGKVSLEAVARRAGTGKAAIYRRWASKEAMTIDLVVQASVAAADIPDTGSLRGDVLTYLTATDQALRHPLVTRILPDLLAARSYHPGIATTLGEQIAEGRREKIGALLHRAVERGELPPTPT